MTNGTARLDFMRTYSMKNNDLLNIVVIHTDLHEEINKHLNEIYELIIVLRDYSIIVPRK